MGPSLRGWWGSVAGPPRAIARQAPLLAAPSTRSQRHVLPEDKLWLRRENAITCKPLAACKTLAGFIHPIPYPHLLLVWATTYCLDTSRQSQRSAVTHSPPKRASLRCINHTRRRANQIRRRRDTEKVPVLTPRAPVLHAPTLTAAQRPAAPILFGRPFAPHIKHNP